MHTPTDMVVLAEQTCPQATAFIAICNKLTCCNQHCLAAQLAATIPHADSYSCSRQLSASGYSSL